MRHKYLIRNRFFSVYWRGSFCWIEIDFGKHTIQLFTKKGFFNYLHTPFPWR